MLWEGRKDGRFTIKWMYVVLDDDGGETFPSKVIWNVWAPPKVGIFAWKAVWCKVLTLDKL